MLDIAKARHKAHAVIRLSYMQCIWANLRALPPAIHTEVGLLHQHPAHIVQPTLSVFMLLQLISTTLPPTAVRSLRTPALLMDSTLGLCLASVWASQLFLTTG